MLRGLAAALAKDQRLLVRDRAGLVFLTLAPIVVITVAGFSLASLYGADPRGTSAYVLPLADEDGGRIGRMLAEKLTDEPAVRLRPVANCEAARALVQRKAAGAALVIPAGTSAAVAAGRPAALVLYTDPVKYLEVALVRGLVQELRHGIEAGARDRADARLQKARLRAVAARAHLEQAARALRQELDRATTRLAALRADAARRATEARRRVEHELGTQLSAQQAAARTRLVALITPLRAFLADLARSQDAFAAWLANVQKTAGRFADRVPAPPAPPAVPPSLAELAQLDDGALAARVLPPDALRLALPPLDADIPALPAFTLPHLPVLAAAHLPGSLAIDESSVTGAPHRLNTFDQNVPGFSVTFLLLGMLLGVSLGLLDERDWGTLERLRAMPTPFGTVLVAKLLARFLVGVAQMIVLLAVGRLAFGVSLGPEPWALLLPTAGIVFAGTAFGLVVAGVAPSREAVLPVGSVVVVTMAAVGGCWWPIDLEPPWMRQAALAFPTTWAMAAFNDLMIRRQSVEAALLPTAVCCAHGLVYTVVGLLLFRRHTRPGA